jgi:FkbM family methyltransferase
MRWRGIAKKLLFGSLPFIRGKFPYYGHTVYFPPGSHTFERTCADGIYERETVHFILSLVESGTTYFDVGANIGLLSVPVLAERPFAKVVSIEAAPDTLRFLRKTQAAAHRRENWTVVGAAVGSENGEAEFWSGTVAMGTYDGLRDTGRGGRKRPVRVPLRTLDQIWEACGCPAISVVKMDIEGGEYGALQGAKSIIARERPVFIVEWTDMNLPAYGIHSERILQFCAEMGYALYASPNLTPVATKLILKMAMSQTETFILVPNERCLRPSASPDSATWRLSVSADAEWAPGLS